MTFKHKWFKLSINEVLYSWKKFSQVKCHIQSVLFLNCCNSNFFLGLCFLEYYFNYYGGASARSPLILGKLLIFIRIIIIIVLLQKSPFRFYCRSNNKLNEFSFAWNVLVTQYLCDKKNIVKWMAYWKCGKLWKSINRNHLAIMLRDSWIADWIPLNLTTGKTMEKSKK